MDNIASISIGGDALQGHSYQTVTHEEPPSWKHNLLPTLKLSCYY